MTTRKRPEPSTTPCSSSSTAIATARGRPPISIPWRCCSTASQPCDNDKATALEAKKSYDKALDAYSAEKKTPASTRLLCLVDSAVLCADVLGDMKEAKQRMDEALAASDLPVLFHVSTLVARGATAAAAATNPGEYEDHRFLYRQEASRPTSKRSSPAIRWRRTLPSVMPGA